MSYASKVRKARRTGWCPLCRQPIRTGHQVGHIPGKGWCHTSCIIAANKTSTEGKR